MKKIVFIDGPKRSGKTYLSGIICKYYSAPIIPDFFHLDINFNPIVQEGGLSALSKIERFEITLRSFLGHIQAIRQVPSNFIVVDRSFLGYQKLLEIENPINPFLDTLTVLVLIERGEISATKEKSYSSYLNKFNYLCSKVIKLEDKDKFSMALIDNAIGNKS